MYIGALSGSSQLCFSGESSLNQTNGHFCFQLQWVWGNGAYINHSISCFNFNMLKLKTFNKSLTFIHLYKVLIHVLSFAHGWVIQTVQHLDTGGGQLEPSPPCFHWGFQVSFQSRIFLPVQQGNFGRDPLCGDARCSHSISVSDEIGTPKINVQASTPVSCPQIISLQSLDGREVGLKISWQVISFQASPVWSVSPPPEHQHWLPHTPNPSTLTFSPLI